MRLTIIPIDSAVYIEGQPKVVDLTGTGIPYNVHALQWMSNFGFIEYVENADMTKPGNENISELPEWAITAAEIWKNTP